MIRKGVHAEHYRVNDDRTQARPLFAYQQTVPASTPDDSDLWTVVISAAEWEQLKAERREVQRSPRVKIRKPTEGGVEVWCGPDADLINLLQYHGYRYDPATRYWCHPNKDAETVANGFAAGRVRDSRIRVDRAWERVDGIVI